jgi:hypothetical protein
LSCRLADGKSAVELNTPGAMLVCDPATPRSTGNFANLEQALG